MSISLLNLHPPPADLQRLVRDGLRRSPRQLPAWMLYDAEGSRLFAEICKQPEYTLTNREIALLELHADAIAAAGGLTTAADRRQLNLAQIVTDGQRIWVPVEGEEVDVIVGLGTGGNGNGAVTAGPVALSTAPPNVLETLPGIGPSLAAAIVEHRQREGPFVTIDALLAVPGIGPAKLDALRGLVTP